MVVGFSAKYQFIISAYFSTGSSSFPYWRVDVNASWTVQFSSVTKLNLTLCDPMDCSTPGFPVHHQLPEFTQTHVHLVSDAIQPSHTLSSLLLLPSMFPNIGVFYKESVLCIRNLISYILKICSPSLVCSIPKLSFDQQMLHFNAIRSDLFIF